MREKTVDLLMLIILVLSGILFLSSATGLFVEFDDMLSLKILQSYTGTVLVGLAITLGVMNLWTKHPFYEYWVVMMTGGIAGANYAVR